MYKTSMLEYITMDSFLEKEEIVQEPLKAERQTEINGEKTKKNKKTTYKQLS